MILKTKKPLKKIIIFLAMIVTIFAIFFNVYAFPWDNTITWSTKNDFENNDVTTDTATTNNFNLIDTTTDNDHITLVKPNDISNTIAAGTNYSLMVKNDGTVWASGHDLNNNFGLDVVSNSDEFIQVADGASSVSAGSGNASFIIKKNGDLWGTGANTNGELGLGNATRKTVWTQTSMTNVKKVSSSANHSIVLKTDGTVWVTGRNANGQLGLGNTTSRTTWLQITNSNINDGTVVDVNTGVSSSYIVKADGTVWVTGLNSSGQLGLGDTTQRDTWTQAGALSNIIAIESYDAFVLALASNGTVWVAGANGSGQLGIGTTSNVTTWKQSDVTDVKKIGVGRTHSLIIKNDLTLWSVGLGTNGALGTGNNITRSIWTYTGINNVSDVSAGYDHTIIRKTDGSAMITGNNLLGAIGSSSDIIYSSSWVKPTLSGTPLYVSNSGSNSNFRGSQFVVMSNGEMFGTGQNSRSNLGIGNALNTYEFKKSLITDVKKVIARSDDSANAATYVLKNDGTVWAIGINAYGQFGVGNTTTRTVWTQSTISNVKDLAVGTYHLIALKNDGTVWTVGLNNYGQLGNGTTTNSSNWIQVPSITNAIAISGGEGSGSYSSYIVTATGELWATGLNTSRQLGLGDATNKSVFTKSNIIDNVVNIYSGPTMAFCKKGDGTIWAVGVNTSGQLGLGDLTSKTTWTQLTNFTNALNISPSPYGTFILKSDNSLWATGRNYYGELATGYNNTISTPVQVATGVTSMALDQYNSIIVKDGEVYTSGYNGNGALGMPVYNNDGIYYGFVNSLTNIKKPAGYYSTGVISGLKINAGDGKIYKWNTISWNGTTPTGTGIKFRTRGANQEDELAAATWSDYYEVSGAKITTNNAQWLEIEMTLTSNDGINTPILEDFSVNYYTDVTKPTNPTEVNAWSSVDKKTVFENNSYHNDEKPYFELSGADDEFGGSDIKGYYAYFGSSETADPYTAGIYIEHNSNDKQEFTPVDDLSDSSTNYLRVRTIDNANNMSDAQTIFTYRFDKTVPISPTSINVTPFGWSRTNSFSFTFDSGFDEALYDSGLLGYQYKFGGTSTDWDDEVFTTNQLIIENIEAYQDGQNIIYLRSIDNAGNTGTVRQAYFYYNGEAPSKPRNLSVNPQSSTTENRFTFSWDEPANYNADIKGYRYSINEPPNGNNTTFINLSSLPPEVIYDSNTKRVTLANIPAATIQGINTFYVVAVDTNDNVSYGNDAAKIDFECVTPAPGNPTGLEIFDTSNRDKQKFSIALNWTEPTNKGVGFKDYVIERSDDGENYTYAGSSLGTSFIDSNLRSKKYHYRVLTRDNSSNISIPSSIVEEIPTGRYTTPPVITVVPEAEAKVTTATVTWVTDREASSFVVVDEKMDFDPTKNQQGQQDSEVKHIVKLVGLKPDTVYYYRVIYTDGDGNTNVDIAENYTFRTLPAPRVTDVKVQDIRLDTASITWYTSEPTTSDLLYGKTTNYSSTITNVSGGTTTSHTARIENLDHSSMYHFAIKIIDIDGNEIISDDYTFETLKFPQITNVRFEPVKSQSTSTFKITWESNVPTNSIVKYQPTGGAIREAVNSELTTKHELIISNLLDNNFYTFNVYGIDQYGNKAVAETNRVKTDYDTRPPVIFNIMSEVESNGVGKDAKGQMIISFETDEPSTAQIEYGLGTTGETYGNKSQEDSSLSTSHVVIVNGLRSSSSYRFRIISKDGSGNVSYSEAQPIITEQAQTSVLDIVINSFRNSIGWMFGGN